MMEGIQLLQHRVVDGTYQAILNWKVVKGVVYIKEGDKWTPTKIPVIFIKDYEL